MWYIVRLHKGHVVDLGNGGFVSTQPPVTEMSTVCATNFSWSPKVVRCTSIFTRSVRYFCVDEKTRRYLSTEIQCRIPEAPRRGYISGGVYVENKMSFFHSDKAVASCATGYIFTENRMTDEAYCDDDGKWSKTLSLNKCVGQYGSKRLNATIAGVLEHFCADS